MKVIADILKGSYRLLIYIYSKSAVGVDITNGEFLLANNNEDRFVPSMLVNILL